MEQDNTGVVSKTYAPRKQRTCQKCGQLYLPREKWNKKCEDCTYPKCAVCGDRFHMRIGTQWRCEPCMEKGLRPGPTPTCKCGCGEEVSWQPERKGWSEYVWGHATRINNPGAIKVGENRNPKTGIITYYEYDCLKCGIHFKHQDKNRIFCSDKCYHAHHSGTNSSLYKDGHSLGAHGNRIYNSYVGGPKEHRLVIEKSIGRPLTSKEIVHHIDENIKNNDINNLFLFHCHSCHMHHHRSGNPLTYKYAVIHPEEADLPPKEKERLIYLRNRIIEKNRRRDQRRAAARNVLKEKYGMIVKHSDIIYRLDGNPDNNDSFNVYLFHCMACKEYAVETSNLDVYCSSMVKHK